MLSVFFEDISCYFQTIMAGRSDLAGVIRGLRLVFQALSENQGQEVRHTWENSSVRKAVGKVGSRLQDAAANSDIRASDLPVSKLRTRDSYQS